jgi:O-antigen ligase
MSNEASMAVLDPIRKEPVLRNYRLLLTIFVSLAGAVLIGMVVSKQPLLPIAALLAIVLLFVLLKWPDTATLLVVFYLYTNVGPVLSRFHGVPSLAGMLFPLLLVVPLVSYLVIKRQKVVVTPVLFLLMIMFVIYAMGAVFSKDIQLAMPDLTEYFIEGLGLFFLLTNIIRTPIMLKRVMWALLIAGALIGGLSLYQQVTGTFDNNYGGFAQVDKTFGTGVESSQGEIQQPRLAGSIGEKNRYAQIMLLLVPLGLFMLHIYSSPRIRVIVLICTVLIIIGGALAFSRGAAVAFVLLILTMVFLRYIKPTQLLLLILGAGAVLWMFPQYALRLSSLNVFSSLSTSGGSSLSGADGAIQERAAELQASILVFRDHPIIGVGPGMFRYYTREYVREISSISITKDYKAHSLFPGVAAESGILGLTCFLLILGVPLIDLAQARKKWMKIRPDLSHMATAFFLMMISYVVTGLFLHLSYMRFFYLMIALAVIASRLGNSETQVGEPSDTAPVAG